MKHIILDCRDNITNRKPAACKPKTLQTTQIENPDTTKYKPCKPQTPQSLKGKTRLNINFSWDSQVCGVSVKIGSVLGKIPTVIGTSRNPTKKGAKAGLRGVPMESLWKWFLKTVFENGFWKRFFESSVWKHRFKKNSYHKKPVQWRHRPFVAL